MTCGVRGVSLQGDDYNPNGVMTGGSRGNTAPVLTRLLEVSEIEAQLAKHEVRTAAAAAAAAAAAVSCAVVVVKTLLAVHTNSPLRSLKEWK